MNQWEAFEHLLRIVERPGLSAVEYAEGNWRIRMSKSEAPISSVVSPRPSLGIPQSEIKPALTNNVEVLVKAGLAGLFCACPAPDKPPFVKVGDVVEEGQVLAVIEAMKILSQVESSQRGTILKILVDDQTSVDANTDLFVIEPTGGEHV